MRLDCCETTRLFGTKTMTIRETLNRVTLSKRDRKILGVCAGFAHATQTPTWVWRAGFLCSLLFGGTGGLVYLILWALIPSANDGT